MSHFSEANVNRDAAGKFTANAAWTTLAIIAFNLTRTAGIIAGLAKQTTQTIRTRLICIPARITDHCAIIDRPHSLRVQRMVTQ